ncbi:autotransporter domain-containing protein [Pannonibacter indicus]|uniref:autotransporter domain-containing protein n=1 Tax=Pannonibacter indicus TaxID=466044 RepID=UPI0035AED4DA
MQHRFFLLRSKQAWSAASLTLVLGVFPAQAQNLSGTGTADVSAGQTWVSNADNSSTVWSGTLQGDGNFEKAGTGTLTFSGTNTYTGTTTVSGGTLVISNGLAIYDHGQVIVSGGATLQVDTGENVGSLSGSGSVVLNGALATNNNDSTSFSGNLSGPSTLIKRGTGTLTLSGTNTNGGGISVDAGHVILSGGNAVADIAELALNGGTAELQSSETVGSLSGSSNLNLNANTLTAGGTGVSAYSGVISGSGALVKSGTGTLTLSGSNTYGGTTTVSGGTLSVASDGNLGAGALVLNGGTLAVTGATTIDNAVTLGASSGTVDAVSNAVTFSGTISGGGSLIKTGAGTLTLSGTSSYTGTTTIAAGTLLVAASSALANESSYEVASGATLQTANGVTNQIRGLSGAGDVVLGNGTLTVSVADAVTNTFSGTISGTGTFAKGGLGILVLTGASNAVDADLRISGGILEFDGGAFSAGGDFIMNAGQFHIKNGGSLTSQMFVVEGVMEVSGGSTVTANDYTQIGVTGNSTLTIAGGQMESKGQAQILGLSGSSVTVSGGTGSWTIADKLTIGIGQGGTNNLTVVDGGTVAVTNGISVDEYSAIRLGTGGQAGTLTAASIDSAGSIAANFTGSLSLDMPISGTGTLAKSGSGTLTLSGANTYTGATAVSGGTLQVEGSLGNTAVSIASGATLGGSGSIGGTVTVLDGGNLNPGSSPGTLTVGSLVLNDSSLLNFELDTPGVAGSGVNDLVSVTNGLTLDGILNIITGSNFGTGSYRLFDYGTLTADNGLVFGDVPAGYELTFSLATPGEVNLVADYTGLQFWNGGQTTANNAVNGGSGTWDSSTANWTSNAGNVATSWAGLTAVFAGSSGGTVTVSGTQTVAGLQFATDGYTLSGTGQLEAGSGGLELRIDTGLTATIATGISGSGAVSKTGAGTIVLSGTNSYTGGTLLNAGTLSVSGDQNLGGTNGSLTFNGGTLASTANMSSSRSMVFNSAGRFDVATGTELQLTGTLTGSGGLLKSGSGALYLTGTSSYSGGTTISAGTLQVGDGHTSGSLGAGDVVNNGTLVFNRSDDVTFAGDISGTGTLEQAGSGTLVITGRVDLSGATLISSGTLQIGDGGTSGEVTGAIVNNGQLIFNRSDSYTVAGTISGSGSIDFTGGGQAQFEGSFAGSTSVIDAQLVLDGTGLTGTQVSVGGGAGQTGILGGNGTIASLTVLSGGIVAPGNSIGTINVAGPVSFAAGSVYEVEVNANGTSDRVIATGTVTIDSGASVRVLAESGSYSASTTYTILSGSSVSGSFDPLVSTNFAFLDAALSYSATDVLLTLTRNDISFAELGLTPNEIAAASGLESLSNASELKDAVTGLSADGARTAFNQVSGEAHASAAGQMLEDSAILRGTALKRLTQEAFDRRFEGGDLAFEGTRVWGEALGSFGRARAADTAFGFSRNMGGLVAGIEARPTDNAMAGIMAGYTGSYLDSKPLGSTATVTAYHAGLYGSYDFAATDWGAVSLRGGASYSWQDFSTRRNVSFASISQRLKADYGTGQVQGFGELAYGHMFSGVMQGAFVEGFTGLALVHQDGAKFTETGGSAALTVRGKAMDTAFSTVGVRGALQTGVQGIPVRLTGELAWRHAFGDVAATQTMVLAGGNPFAIRGRALDRDALLIGTGVSMTMTEKLDLTLAYQGELAAKATDHSVKGSFRLRF